MAETIFVNSKKYSFSENWDCLLENEVPILKLKDIVDVNNLNNEELIISTETDTEDDYEYKTYRFNIASRSLDYLFDRDVSKVVYLQNKLIFIDFPNEQEQKEYSVDELCKCMYFYDFDTKELKLILPKDIFDECLYGYYDKVYFMYEQECEFKINTLEINTLRVEDYYDNAVSFLIKDDTICIKNAEESKLIVRKLNSSWETIINDLKPFDYEIKNNHVIFIENDIIYSLDLMTKEKIILGLHETGEWLEDVKRGNIISTTKGKEYNILEDRSNSKEIKGYFLSKKVERIFPAITVMVILILIIISSIIKKWLF